MTEPTVTPKKEIAYVYAVDQQVSINTFLDVDIDGETFKLQLTTRHQASTEKIVNDFLATIGALRLIRETYPKPTLPAATAPKQDAAVTIALDEGNPQMAAEIQAAGAAVPPSRKGAGVIYQTFDADIVEVLPQPDEKVTICFYGTNDKYPRVKVNKWKLAAADGLMKHVTSESMGKPAKYTLRCRVYYTDGAEYHTDNGSGHYKDIEHVRPI